MKKGQTSPNDNNDDYKVPTFKPRKIIMTKELARRQAEEELRKLYSAKKEK